MRRVRCHFAESVYNVGLQKSIPAQIRQLILCISNDKGSVDGFDRESTFAKRSNIFCEIRWHALDKTARNPKPRTPSSKPQTPNPINPEPRTPDLTPQTPNPIPQFPNPKPRTPNSKHQTLNPKPQTPKPTPQTLNPKPRSSRLFAGSPGSNLARSCPCPGTNSARIAQPVPLP